MKSFSHPGRLTNLSDIRRFQEIVHPNSNQTQQTTCHWAPHITIVFRASVYPDSQLPELEDPAPKHPEFKDR
jgi:hypothetical protein